MGSTRPKIPVPGNDTYQKSGISGHEPAHRTQESRFPQILLISHIAEMQGEFANTLVIEMGADGSSRVREAE